MSYVIGKSDGRFEIRESVHTPAGPRARTLATFRTLDDDVLDRAAARASRAFDRDAVIARARARGAVYVAQDATALAARLLRTMATGATVPPTLAQALRSQLGTGADSLPDTIPPLLDWIGASAAERGRALRDLLRMTDRIPPSRRRRERAFPRIRSRPA